MTQICYISATPRKIQTESQLFDLRHIVEYKNKTIQIFNFKSSQEEVDNLYKESEFNKL